MPTRDEEYSPGLIYLLRHNPDASPYDLPAVALGSTAENDIPKHFWEVRSQQPTRFRLPTLTHSGLNIGQPRQATNIAYNWLLKDLHAVGWLSRPLHIVD